MASRGGRWWYEPGAGGAIVVVDRRGDDDGGRRALVLPGLNFTPELPLLHYTIRTLRSRHWTVDVVRWRPLRPDVHRWARAGHALDQGRPAAPGGRQVAPHGGLPAAIALDCAGIWLTPLLYEPEQAALRLDRQLLPVGGTADRSWDPAAAAATGAQVMEIPDANHSLEIADVQEPRESDLDNRPGRLGDQQIAQDVAVSARRADPAESALSARESTVDDPRTGDAPPR